MLPSGLLTQVHPAASTDVSSARTYENVVPSENSAIVADAGRVSFATEAGREGRSD